MREELSEELERHIEWLLESDEREEREKELERLGYGLKVGMVELRGMLLVLLGLLAQLMNLFVILLNILYQF